MMFEYFEYFLDFFYSVAGSILGFIYDHKIVFSFLLVPLIASAIFVVIDFIFDVRDSFSEFNSFKDYFRYSRYKLYYSKHKKQNLPVNLNDIYLHSIENASYQPLPQSYLKHFQDNERFITDYEHTNHKNYNYYNSKYPHLFELTDDQQNNHDEILLKMEESLNRHSIPKHNDKKKVNLDIEVED